MMFAVHMPAHMYILFSSCSHMCGAEKYVLVWCVVSSEKKCMVISI